MIILDKEIYTIKEIAKMKGQSVQALHQIARRRKITGKRIGFMRVFNKEEMEKLIAPENKEII